MILDAAGLALSQMMHRRFLKVVGIGIASSLAALVGLYHLLRQGALWLVGDGFSIPFWGHVDLGQGVVGWASLVAIMGASVFLMVPIAQAVQSVFLDEIADAVEDRHYPHVPRGTSMPFVQSLMDGLRAMGVLIAVNIAALILYVVFPPLAPIIFVGVNGFLLGREYFLLAAQRHMQRPNARALGRRHAVTVWALGALMVIPLTIPVINLAVPVLGAASFTHLFQMLRARG